MINKSSNQSGQTENFSFFLFFSLPTKIEKEIKKKTKLKPNPSLTTTFFFSVSFLRLKADN